MSLFEHFFKVWAFIWKLGSGSGFASKVKGRIQIRNTELNARSQSVASLPVRATLSLAIDASSRERKECTMSYLFFPFLEELFHAEIIRLKGLRGVAGSTPVPAITHNTDNSHPPPQFQRTVYIYQLINTAGFFK